MVAFPRFRKLYTRLLSEKGNRRAIFRKAKMRTNQLPAKAFLQHVRIQSFSELPLPVPHSNKAFPIFRDQQQHAQFLLIVIKPNAHNYH